MEAVTTTSTQISRDYTLGDLTTTNQNLASPNLPSSQEEMNNLWALAAILDELKDALGPFQLLSGFRTKELQEALAEGGAPTGSGTSFHELGRAVDIYPSTMSIKEFIGRLLANNELKLKFAEIIIKETQNSIHLAINVPGDKRVPKVLKLTDFGKYAPMPDGELFALIEPYMPVEVRESAVKELVTAQAGGFSPAMLLGIVTAIGALFFMRKKS